MFFIVQDGPFDQARSPMKAEIGSRNPIRVSGASGASIAGDKSIERPDQSEVWQSDEIGSVDLQFSQITIDNRVGFDRGSYASIGNKARSRYDAALGD